MIRTRRGYHTETNVLIPRHGIVSFLCVFIHCRLAAGRRPLSLVPARQFIYVRRAALIPRRHRSLSLSLSPTNLHGTTICRYFGCIFGSNCVCVALDMCCIPCLCRGGEDVGAGSDSYCFCVFGSMKLNTATQFLT